MHKKPAIKFAQGKIFIAGGTGFLGRHLAARLQHDGIPFTSSSLSQGVDPEPGRKGTQRASASYGVDFRDIKQLEKLFRKEKPDVVINAAAFIGGIQFSYQKPGEIFFNNTMISANLIECARRASVSLFINPISNCSYPDVSGKPLREDEWWDGSINESVLSYGIVRKASWVNAWSYHKQYGMKFVNLLFPNMYGPGNYFDEVRSHALSALVKKIILAKRNKAKEVVIWGSGKPVREWLYIEDGVEAIMRSLKIKPTIEPINIGSGSGISIKDLALLIRGIVGYKGKLVFDTKYPDGAPYKIMSVDRCKEVFGWLPSTDLKYGIQKTVEYFQEKT